jgi:hypothetical protein
MSEHEMNSGAGRLSRVPVTRREFLAAAAVAAGTTGVDAGDRPPPSVLGYPDRLSVLPGEALRLHVSATVAAYDIAIERIGAVRETVWSRQGLPGVEREVPADASANGCRWPVSFEVPIGVEWRSGVYQVMASARGMGPDGEGGKPEPLLAFVVRPPADGPRARILLQLSMNTENAYNNFGGFSLYAYNGRDGVQGSRVSFLRPAPGSTLKRWEIPFIQWAESQGYRIDYAVNDDLEFHPELLEKCRLVLSVGHDEYWSKPMRDTIDAFIDRGGNVAFFSGNTCCWQVRSEADGLVCHKQNFRDDPVFRPEGPNPTLTTLWSHPLVGRPENRLTNVGLLGGGFHKSHGMFMDGSGGFTVERPAHWILAGTGLAAGAEFGGERSIVGYECDGCEFTRLDGLPVPTGRDGTPENFEIVATAPASWGEESTLLWWDAFPRKEQGHACLGVSVRPSGGMVFTAGTTDWSHGLLPPADPAVARITRNVIDRLSAV